MNDYEKYIFYNIETKLTLNAWYNINPKRSDINEFISAIKKRIDLYGDCEFNSNYTKFKKIRTWEEEMEYWKNNDGTKSRKFKEKNK